MNKHFSLKFIVLFLLCCAFQIKAQQSNHIVISDSFLLDFNDYEVKAKRINYTNPYNSGSTLPIVALSNCKGELSFIYSPRCFYNAQGKAFLLKDLWISSLLIPVPKSKNLYYFFYTKQNSDSLYILTINTDSLNNNLIVKDTQIFLSKNPHKNHSLGAPTKHSNNVDFWVTYSNKSDSIINILMDENGVKKIVKSPSIFIKSINTPRLLYTHSGKHLFILQHPNNAVNSTIYIHQYSFNNFTGKLDSFKIIPLRKNGSTYIKSYEINYFTISPNDSLLYYNEEKITAGNSPLNIVKAYEHNIVQIPIYKKKPIKHKRIIYHTNFNKLYKSSNPNHKQVSHSFINAPNGKTYTIGDVGFRLNGFPTIGQQIGEIAKPNKIGNQCLYNSHKIITNQKISTGFGLLRSLYQPLRSYEFSISATCQDTALFTYLGDSTFNYLKIMWGDGDTTTLPKGKFEKGLQLKHRYKTERKYYISIAANTNNCGFELKNRDSIQVLYAPKTTNISLRQKPYCHRSQLVIEAHTKNTNRISVRWDTDSTEHYFGSQKKVRFKYHYTQQGTQKIHVSAYNSPACVMHKDTFALIKHLPNPNNTWLPQHPQIRSGADSGKYALCTNEPISLKDTNKNSQSLKTTVYWADTTAEYLVEKTIKRLPMQGKAEQTIIIKDSSQAACVSLDSFTFIILPAPKVMLIADTLQCFKGNLFRFLFRSTDDSLSHTLTFKNTNIGSLLSTDSIIYKHFDTTGLIKYKLTSRNKLGCQTVQNKTLTIAPSPTAIFTVSNTGCVGKSALFSDSSKGKPSTVLWTFGDADSLKLNKAQLVNHSFKDTGKFTVTLWLKTAQGCADTLAKNIQIYHSPKANFTLPKASFCISKDSLTLKNTSTIQIGNIQLFQWKLLKSAHRKAAQTDRNYWLYFNQKAAKDSLQLIVISNKNCMDTASQSIEFLPKPIANFSYKANCPTDNWEFSTPTTADSFVWKWNAQASEKTILKTIKHNFGKAGNYWVHLRAQNSNNCWDSLGKSIVVFPKPKAEINLKYKSMFKNRKLTFDISASPVLGATYFWDFGDNQTATGISHSHVYDTSISPYLLQLIVKNTQNCSDTATQSVVVISENLFAFPTAFTPNGDGINENFEFSGYEFVKTIHTEVINRWGQKMLIQDGKPNFTNLPEGVYVYLINIEDIYGKTHKLKGVFRVLR